MSSILPFNSIKEFAINYLIHEGPYTQVFCGRQTNLKRDVLIKLLKPAGNDELKKRFEREARVYARLNHPNIVSVFAFVFIASLILFYLIKVTIGLRVSEKEEEEGLDVMEHGVSGYANFMMSHER